VSKLDGQGSSVFWLKSHHSRTQMEGRSLCMNTCAVPTGLALSHFTQGFRPGLKYFAPSGLGLSRICGT
jgi:hypothetical protein